MEALKDFDPLLDEVDLAYLILKKEGAAKKFRDLVLQIFAVKNIPSDNHQLMAAIHTQLNLDNRFSYLGQGTWGLKEWNQAKIVRREISPSEIISAPVRKRRSLQDEIEQEETDFFITYEDTAIEDGLEWEE